MEYIIAIVFIAIVGGILVGKNELKKLSEKRSEIESYIAELSDFSATFVYLSEDFDTGIAIDEPRLNVCLLSREGLEITHRVLEYKEILSSELFEDGQSMTKTVRSSQAVGAVVGGLLLGGVGAVIGGLSGKKVEEGKSKRIELRLVVNDSANPIYDICFLNNVNGIKKDTMVYKNAFEEARLWHARFDVLIKRADKESASSQPASEQIKQEGEALPLVSIGDELKKLVDLKEQGVLTDSEFAVQKAKLLG